jgi:pimeloyl-ACP methyl ester carboxylesterase
VRFDLAGHGLSARPATDYTFDFFLAQALEVLDSVDVGKVAILGHSFGSVLAAALAPERPSRVERLVLTAPLLGFEDGKVWPRTFGLPCIWPVSDAVTSAFQP